jgi:hypothetical protein
VRLAHGGAEARQARQRRRVEGPAAQHRAHLVCDEQWDEDTLIRSAAKL